MHTFEGISILVFGLGKSGRAVARLLAEKGSDVQASDDVSDAVDAFAREAPRGIRMVPPGQALATAVACDCVVVSPGVPDDHPLLRAARDAGVPVIGEIETAYRYTQARIVGVTATNGKSTTVGIIGEILMHAGIDVVVAGNVGTPFAEVLRSGDHDTIVLELSSFQLDTIDQFKCDVAVLLNVTPDHLDRYGDSFNAYAASKARILNRADQDSFYVYNANDPVTRELAERNPGQCVAFSSTGSLESGVYLEDGQIRRRWNGVTDTVCERSLFEPVGIHNLENALAAVAAAIPLGVADNAIAGALRAYRPLPHRMRQVAVIDDVTYINDSKATNVDATIKSIQSIDGLTVVILGGRDKQGDFAQLGPLSVRIRAAVLIGEAAGKIRGALGADWNLVDATDMANAVSRARDMSQPGDTVLLAPACASFDMFTSYGHRGDVFTECVLAIAGGAN